MNRPAWGKGYKVTFALSGFATVEKPPFDVYVDKDTQVNGVLKLAAQSAEVVVTGEVPSSTSPARIRRRASTTTTCARSRSAPPDATT